MRRAELWIALGLIALNLLVFAQVRHFQFVNWDDPEYVSENPHIAGGLTAQSVRWALTGRVFYWHPLTWISHILDVQFFGLNAGAHHLVSLAFHILNSLLVFFLFRRLTGATYKSAFVAALFAIHPSRVESVAWVAERKDVLSTFFLLLAALAYLWYAARPRWARYAAVAALFALGLLAKPMVMTLPLVFVLLDYWPLGRMAGGAEPAPGARLAALVKEKLPLLAMSAAAVAMAYAGLSQARAMAVDVSFAARVANAAYSYYAYIATMFWPVDLAAYYPFPAEAPVALAALGALGLAGITYAVWRARRRRPYLLVGWLWYVVTLFPVCGIVQAGNQARADRFTYVPLIGLFAMLAWGASDLLARWRRRRAALAAVAVVAIALSAGVARAQVQYWQDGLSLWRHVESVTPEDYITENNLGVALHKLGEEAEAIPHLSEAVRLHPSLKDGQLNLGVALANVGRLPDAIAHLTVAAQSTPDSAEIQTALGGALARSRRLDEAIPCFEKALSLRPGYAEAQGNLANALADKGRAEEAIPHYREAIRLKPADPYMHVNLAITLADLGQGEGAARELAEALRLDPGNAQARRFLDLLSARPRSPQKPEPSR